MWHTEARNIRGNQRRLCFIKEKPKSRWVLIGGVGEGCRGAGNISWRGRSSTRKLVLIRFWDQGPPVQSQECLRVLQKHGGCQFTIPWSEQLSKLFSINGHARPWVCITSGKPSSAACSWGSELHTWAPAAGWTRRPGGHLSCLRILSLVSENGACLISPWIFPNQRSLNWPWRRLLSYQSYLYSYINLHHLPLFPNLTSNYLRSKGFFLRLCK